MKVRFFALLLALIPLAVQAQDFVATDLATLQGQLVRSAGDIRRIEIKLQVLDARLADLKTRSDDLQKQYDSQRTKMAAALAAMTHLRRMPEEAALIRPGGPLQAARTSMLLQASLPAIEEQASDVRKLLTDLQATQQELGVKTNEARDAKAKLDQSHTAMQVLLDKRQAEGSVRPEDLAAINKLARDARDLRDLLSDLDEQNGVPGVIPQGTMPDMGPADGILPVSGIIRTRYGQKDEIGARSSGLTIETLPGAIVVAPLPGIVRFAGNFKGYGNIVIIAHAGGYHSLVAGLGTIYVQPGQSIVSGEPIGILEADKNQNQAAGGIDDNARERVYYELRLHGQPVDPARKLPDLG